MFLDDVDYFVEKLLPLIHSISFNVLICISCHHKLGISTVSDAPLACLLMQLHHIGSQEESLVAVQEELTGADP
jgi:hypothetical protein